MAIAAGGHTYMESASMATQFITLDLTPDSSVSSLKKQFDDMWAEQNTVIVFLLGDGDGFDKIAKNIEKVASDLAVRRGLWIKQPDKIIPDEVGKLRNNDKLIVLSSAGFKRKIGSWRDIKKAASIFQIAKAFNEAVERDAQP